jgi:hypothetical protein
MDFLKPYLLQTVFALLALVVVLLVMVLSTNARLARTQRLVRNLLSGPGGEDLETMLKRCLAESKESLARCDEQESRIDELSTTINGCVQRIGLVRYDAFNDVAGGQSFSLALLDNHRNGTIVTSLLGRTDGRCFGKPVYDGQTEQTLSDEEAEALKMALTGTFASSGAARPNEKTSRRDREKAR